MPQALTLLQSTVHRRHDRVSMLQSGEAALGWNIE